MQTKETPTINSESLLALHRLHGISEDTAWYLAKDAAASECANNTASSFPSQMFNSYVPFSPPA